MSEDLKHALRHVLCLPNPSAMQGARWRRVRLNMNSSQYSLLAKLDGISLLHRASQANSFPRRRGKAGMGAVPRVKTPPSQPFPAIAGEGVNLRRMRYLSPKFPMYVELKHQRHSQT